MGYETLLRETQSRGSYLCSLDTYGNGTQFSNFEGEKCQMEMENVFYSFHYYLYSLKKLIQENLIVQHNKYGNKNDNSGLWMCSMKLQFMNTQDLPRVKNDPGITMCVSVLNNNYDHNLSSITCFKYICPCLICQKHCLFFIQKLKYYSDLETHSEGNEALQRATFYTQHRHSELLKSSVQRAFLFISQ